MKEFNYILVNHRLALTFGALLVSVWSAAAIAIPLGAYSLGSYTDGSEAEDGGSFYGLRLERLNSGYGTAFAKYTFGGWLDFRRERGSRSALGGRRRGLCGGR